MESYTLIIIVFGVLTFGVLFLLYFINRLIFLKNKIEKDYQNVYEYLETRATILEEMIVYIKENLEHEKHVIKKFENAVEVIMNAKKEKTDLKKVKKTKDMIMKFIELEQTYAFLKKEIIFQKIKEEALTNEGRIEYSIESYDKGVTNYNNYQENRFVSFLSELLKFPKYDYYNK